MVQQIRFAEDQAPESREDNASWRHERRDAAENRKRVLEAAQQLFQENGVEAVSMHQIAQAAGVGQGTLYRRYAHKGQLCSDLLAESADRFKDELEHYLGQAAGDTSAVDRLTRVLARLLELMDTKLSLLAAIGDACWGDRRIEKFRTPAYQSLHSTITTLLAEGVDTGEMRPLDPVFTADMILAALSPDAYQFQRDERGLTPEQILERVCRIFTDGPTTKST
jgi:AcrR family transcriptional regulator